MTLYQFRLLDEMEQIEAVWNAVHLMDRTEGLYEYKLYQRDGFYIELKRQIENDVLVDMRAFKSTTPLETYFEASGPELTPLENGYAGHADTILAADDFLDDVLCRFEQSRKAARRGKVLVWYVLGPIALLCVAYTVWRMITGQF